MGSMSGLTGGAYIAAYAASGAFAGALAESLQAEPAPCAVYLLSLVADAKDTPAMTASGIRFDQG
jgi:short-subunit dehydrogenase